MAETLNKKALAESLANECDLTKKDAETYVNKIFDSIQETLVKGDSVDIFGFGKFSITERSARQGINPATKEKIEIPATKAVKFKVSKSLKDAVK